MKTLNTVNANVMVDAARIPGAHAVFVAGNDAEAKNSVRTILTEGFVALEDDKTIVPNEAILPLMRVEAATPEVIGIVDQVSAVLTTDILKALLVKVEVDKKSPTAVAEEYLTSIAG